MQVLVLGGGGPIGAALARRAAAVGCRVLVTTRQELDASDAAAVRTRLSRVKPDAVINLVNPPLAADDDGIDTAADVAGALTRQAAESGVARLIFASSAAVYGDAGTAPFTESDDLRGVSAYARVKISSEQAVAAEAERTGISALSMRIFNVFGDGCHRSLINKLIRRERPVLAMSANYVRDYVHVDDVADALLAASGRPDFTGAVNVATGEATDNLMLARAAPPEAFEALHELIVSYSVGDPSLMLSSLGWKPTRSAIAELRTRLS
ncbi:NAD-dependent epimerase/dehydratase family protein [Microbacterium timonense]|uniref:NAD-dependent epimerase/dehydratase family protein n=1 Tax=Microbacterium timonense TaxID=2086576 RepID=UPI000D111E44|nr:NAD-dependent epimerase/dehydratase family protein [Microbacterium timonense]